MRFTLRRLSESGLSQLSSAVKRAAVLIRGDSFRRKKSTSKAWAHVKRPVRCCPKERDVNACVNHQVTCVRTAITTELLINHSMVKFLLLLVFLIVGAFNV